ncbi:MAG: DUF2088 domain-containing protein [Anaerolineae bacterium]|nr:DUF2088 domain-containing protein [Anaerolineae bacterium]
MLEAKATAETGRLLNQNTIRSVLETGLGGKFARAKVLILIPDHTRTMPMPLLFRMLTEILADAKKLDFMVALGTHPPLSDASLRNLIGISPLARREQYAHIGLLNHAWDNPKALAKIGVLTQGQVRALAGNAWHPSLGEDVPVFINKKVLDYDQIIILGPTFPHEVVGFSGGAKYLFPGIAGPDMINATHWLGALITIMDTIGIKHTPVRDMIHAAAAMVPTPITLASLVVDGEGVAGVFVGDHIEAYEAAADLSAQRHIIWVDKPFERVLSWAPAMYDELWTGAKAMYKLEPAIADGGEVIVYAPHLETVSHVHGKYIYQVGYHVRDYFLAQWEEFKKIPKGVLAHSTHLKGSGTYTGGVEKPRINVTLASRIPEKDCARLNLGYIDYEEIIPDTWAGREDAGILFVPKAGEMLYRLKK